MLSTGYSVIMTCLFILTASLLAISLCNFFSKRSEYSKTIAARREYIHNSALSAPNKELLLELSNRAYVLYYSYLLHKNMSILCSIYSLLFTIVSFAFSFMDLSRNTFLTDTVYIVSFLAFFFVAVTVYINPQKHAAQYLKAWRILNHELISSLYDPSHHTPNGPDTQAIIAVMKYIEDSLSVDED